MSFVHKARQMLTFYRTKGNRHALHSSGQVRNDISTMRKQLTVKLKLGAILAETWQGTQNIRANTWAAVLFYCDGLYRLCSFPQAVKVIGLFLLIKVLFQVIHLGS